MIECQYHNGHECTKPFVCGINGCVIRSDGVTRTDGHCFDCEHGVVSGSCKICRVNKIEMVDHPAHYGGADDPYEAIKVIEAWRLGFCLGNTVKYISRVGKKGNPIEDLKKAKWYLDHYIKKIESEVDK